jgi:hypothetical protein
MARHHRPELSDQNAGWEQLLLIPADELRLTFTLVFAGGRSSAQFGFMLEDWSTDDLLALETEAAPSDTHLFQRWAEYVERRTWEAVHDLLP